MTTIVSSTTRSTDPVHTRSGYCTCRPGATIRLTGPPSAGSRPSPRYSPLTCGPARRVEVLDGDEARAHLSRGLGFTREGCAPNVADRSGRRGTRLQRHRRCRGGHRPLRRQPRGVRARHEHNDTAFVEVHVATGRGVHRARCHAQSQPHRAASTPASKRLRAPSRAERSETMRRTVRSDTPSWWAAA